MKVLHLIGGGDEGGAKSHVLSLVQQLGKHIEVKLLSLRPGSFAEDAKAMGIDTEVIRSGNIFHDVKTVRNIIYSGKYDILHTHGAKANMIGVFVKKKTAIPVVSTVHSDYRLDYLHSILKMYTFGLINTVALRFIDYYIGVSSNYKDMLIQRGFPAHRIYTVYNGIPFDNPIEIIPRAEFAKKYHVPLKTDDVVVGILARLHPVKGHTVLLDAAKKVLEKFPETKFLIGGPGDDLKPALERKAKQLGISNNVFFLGMVTEPFSFFEHIDINVLASYSESFPYVILEGARMQKATVSSRVGGLDELFTQGENGFLYAPGDSDALAGHLINLLENPEKRKRMGENLYKTARARFSLKAMTDTQLGIYQAISAHEKQNVKDSKEYDLVILGYYGYRNSGDDAILKSLIDHLRQNHKDISTVVLSNRPSETRKLYSVQSIYRFHPFRIPILLSKTRLFVAGGGTLLQDDTSSRSLWYYLFMLHLAMKKGTKMALFANGLGPLTKKKNRKAVAELLDRMHVITLRDPNAFEELKSLDVTKPVTKVTADPAMALSFQNHASGHALLTKEGIPVDKTLIALCLRKWKKVNNADRLLAAIVDRIATQFDATPVFISMQYPDDIRFSKKVLLRMKTKGYVLQNRYSVDETLSIFKNTSMVIGMRLHSLIYAAKLSIPMLGLAYEPKVDYFMQSIHQPYVRWDQSFSMDELMEKIETVWQNASEIRQELDQMTPIFERKVKDAMELTLSLLPEE